MGENCLSFIDLKISCIEEIAFRKGFISEKQLRKIAENYPSEYGQYLKQLIAN